MSELVTAGVVRDVFLFPSMDARAANIEQRRLLFNSSPEPDSLFEHLELLRSGESRSWRALIAITTDLSASNSIEGDHELGIAGAADQLATDLRDRELNGNAPVPLAAKAIARRLRGSLTSLSQPAGIPATDLLKAATTIAETIRRVPRLQLLSPAVAHELGRRKYELLCELVDSEKTRAAQLVTAGPAARGHAHEQA